ncbi:hypothetical protein [Sporichthya sp.]|uniref:hypothetical protein n=1 Tax=Sporichthya sp. TaxID=65475 RepID=UPI0017D4340F|nr:hypothetical protein [Sporichthya sp.]MBA3744324.1 hypothetical protein [Sporichthya sp.]
MTVHAVRSAVDGHDHVPQAKGNILDVLMLQFHVIAAVFWLLSCLLVALMAVPALRKLPSTGFLHELQVRRELVTGVLWATFAVTLGSGTYLLFQQAAYDPPFSAGDFDELEAVPYGLPYYYALYGKIALFLIMGAASLVLSMEANRAAQRSEACGGPAESEAGFDDDEDWLDEEVLPDGVPAAPRGSSAVEAEPVEPVEIGAGGTLQATRAPAPRTSKATLWASVATLAVGAGGIGFCVTLIKYFHELARAAVVYEQLRRR